MGLKVGKWQYLFIVLGICCPMGFFPVYPGGNTVVMVIRNELGEPLKEANCESKVEKSSHQGQTYSGTIQILFTL